jgi:phosphoribosylformylglycinamidine synthase
LPVEPGHALRTLLGTPSIASKRWVYEQYDPTVQAGTVIGPGGDAALVLVPGTTRGIAVSTDCNARYVLLDPYEGGKAAVAESARNVACTGAQPIGITNCLNFGNPERPDVFFQFREACRGMSDACRALGTPVTGGNVSFYNESPLGAVEPTPVVGMVGLLPDVRRAVRAHVRAKGDVLFLLGETRGHLGGSSYFAHVLGEIAGAPPPVDLEAEACLVELLVALAAKGTIASAHDVSDGGLAVAAVETAIGGPYTASGFGLELDLREIQGDLGVTALLFGEDQARALVSAAPESVDAVRAAARAAGVPCAAIGAVGAQDGRFHVMTSSHELDLPIADLRAIFDRAIPRLMGDTADEGSA